MFRSLLIACLLLIAQVAHAQLSKGGLPYSFQHDLDGPIAVYTTPTIDRPALLAEDEIDLSYNLPLRFAFGHEVKLNLANQGSWTSLDNGDRIWQLTIECPKAININLLYSNFFLPPGANLFLYGTGGEQVLGAFTNDNNKKNGRFASALVHGNELTLEYYEPYAVRGQGRIEIAQIGHGYRNLDGEANDDNEKASGACQVDVNCEEGDNWQTQKKGVAKIVMDGLYLCSGTLVNNTANDCKPLFLTANHCLAGGIVQDAVVNPDVSGYVFYWNFEVPECGAAGPTPEQTTAGGTVLANAGVMTTGSHTLLSSDFALIQLDESPRGVYDVYFNGWDASGEPGESGAGIHHPAGDVKKISTHHIVPSEDGYYWSLFWSATTNGHSVTEGGSSGSALFRENGRIIGQLFGGGSVNCDDPANDLGLYGKLSYSWTNDDEPVLTNDPRRRLLDWLDPIGQGSIRSVDGAYDPCSVKMVYFKTTEATLTEENTSATDGCRAYADYTYELGITPYPRDPVTANISASGTAEAGANRDFELLTTSVTFSNVVNSRSFTVRVYDDAYVEANETIEFFLTPIASGVDAVDVLSGADVQQLIISNADVVPQNHVQTVRNEENPAEEYLGPLGTVYFTVPGSDGMIMAVENLTSHDYGCTQVIVDNAGGSANNNWTNGTTVSKTIVINPQNPANADVRIQLYYGNGEITGWEWFNDEGLDRDDLNILRFNGQASTANEATVSTFVTARSAYGSDYRFTATLDGFTAATNGLTLGSLTPGLPFGLGSYEQNNSATTLVLAPNVTPTTTSLRWNSPTEGMSKILVQNLTGQLMMQLNVFAAKGFNALPINAGNFPPGTYWVRLQGKDKSWQQARLIVQ